MKPSEQFANLRQAAEAMGDCQDKADLLALFKVADELHGAVDEALETIKKMGEMNEEVQRDLRWLRKWRPLLSRLQEEKVVSLERARRSDANL